MDAIEQYLTGLKNLAAEFVQDDRTAADVMQRDATTFAVPSLAALRAQFLAPQDRERVRGLLSTGLLSGETGDQRLASLVVCLELDDEIGRQGLQRRFVAYENDHPLFETCAELWDSVRDRELVHATALKHLGRTGLVKAEGGWGRIEELLPPELFRWAEQTFAGKPLFVRLDPWFAAKDQPDEPLREAAVRPARPDWWSTLGLRNREHDGGHYVLEPGMPGDSTNAYLEYHSRRVRTLEVHAKRDNRGNLSMMIEELAVGHTPDLRLLGRCIHLDTDAERGSEAETAPLNHLDLAINAYFDAAAKRREGERLADGRVVDASVRAHVLRVEQIPFSASAEFARQFFHSTTLLSEWLQDQFGAQGPVLDQ